MISNWKHYEGGTYLEQTIISSWRCTFRDGDIAKWIDEQGFTEEEDYDLNFRFNSGDPRYFLEIYNEKLAADFALRWVQ